MRPRQAGMLCALLLAGLQARRASAASGEDGFQFLDLAAGTRQAALGRAATAVADDVNAVLANPAALAELRRGEASFQYLRHLEESSHHVMNLSHPTASGSLGFQLQTFDHGTFPAYDRTGAPAGETKAGDLLVGVGYGRALGASWSAGAVVKQVQETIGDDQAKAIALDAGVLYRPAALPRLRFGAAARNQGSGASFAREETPLPAAWSVGASWRGFSEAWTTAVDVDQPRDGASVLRVGQEVWVNPSLALRGGLHGRDAVSAGWSAGLGFRFRDIEMDYAFASGKKGFESVHRAGILFRFGGKAEALYQEGVRLLQAGSYAEALLKFKKALDVDPRHRRAVARMREAARALRRDREEPRP